MESKSKRVQWGGRQSVKVLMSTVVLAFPWHVLENAHYKNILKGFTTLSRTHQTHEWPKTTWLTQVPCCKEIAVASLFDGDLKRDLFSKYVAKYSMFWQAEGLAQIRLLFTVWSMNWGVYFLSQTNMLFSLGSYKCQPVANKKAALVVKKYISASLASNLRPFLLTFLVSLSITVTLN